MKVCKECQRELPLSEYSVQDAAFQFRDWEAHEELEETIPKIRQMIFDLVDRMDRGEN